MTTSSEKSFLAEVLEADKEHFKEDVVYEFSNERKFESTNKTDSGIYDGE